MRGFQRIDGSERHIIIVGDYKLDLPVIFRKHLRHLGLRLRPVPVRNPVRELFHLHAVVYNR